MSHYCPLCKDEFQDTVSSCPKDKVPLVPKLPADEIWLDFYLAQNQIEAERIVSLLRSVNIKAKESDSGISQLPVDSESRFVVLVPKSQRALARQIIEDARRDHVISTYGSFL